MYYVDFVYESDVVDQVQHTENHEQVWMAAGLDLLNEMGSRASDFAIQVQYADQALKASPDYYRDVHGHDEYIEVLHFLDTLHDICETWPDAVIEVRY